MSSANSSFTEANVPTRNFGSEHDPVLDGVTRGLEALFPLVQQHTSWGDDPEVMQDNHEE
ncbi:hypothetical protein [Methylobacterium indicum]|uniref:hypothetical protein n=1 Tax=Methylobacterium indicum TaxID=1775910 RepID=UPI000F76AC1A|nr:hypothetical protein [Methylobacterium indicum]